MKMRHARTALTASTVRKNATEPRQATPKGRTSTAENARPTLRVQASVSATPGSTESFRKRSATLPENRRDRFRRTGEYYRKTSSDLSESDALGWDVGACPFHYNSSASLNVHVNNSRNAWRCERHGGGDLVGFDMNGRGLGFRHAERELVGSSR